MCARAPAPLPVGGREPSGHPGDQTVHDTVVPGSGWRSGREFRQLFAARLSSQLADGAFTVCLAGLVLFSPDKAPDATTLALDLAAVLLPYSLLGPFSAILIDRVRRRDLLLFAGILRAGLVAATAGLLVAGGTTGVIVLAVGVLALSRFALSTLSASLPATVATGDLVPAGSLTTTSGTAASIVGGGLAALVRLVAGSSPHGLAVVAVVPAVGYVLAGAVAALAGRDAFGPRERRDWGDVPAEARAVVSETVEGARYLCSRPEPRAALIAVNASRLCYGFVFVTLVLLLRHGRDGSGSASLGAVGAGLVVGTVAAAFATPSWVRRRDRPAVISSALLGAGTAVTLLCPWLLPGLYVVAGVMLGFATAAAKICSDAIVAGGIDDGHRGRVFALADTSFNVSYVTAALIAALVLPPSGRSPGALVVAGLLWAGVGVAYRLRGAGGRAEASAPRA